MICVRADVLTQMQLRVIQDAWRMAAPDTYKHAATRYRWAMSRPGDFGPGHPRFRGTRTVSEQQELDAVLAATALACDRKARMLSDELVIGDA